MEFIAKLFKNKPFVYALLVVILGVSYYGYKHKNTASAAPQYVTQAVQKGTITTNVSGSGQVSSSNSLDIKPGSSGKITSVKVSVGQEVKAGDVLVTLEQQSAANQVQQAKVSLMQAQAAYDKLMAGATASDLLPTKLSVEAAQQALDKAQADLQSTIQDQQRTVDKALNTLLNSGLDLQQSDTVTTADVTLTGSYTGSSEGTYTVSLYNSAAGMYYQISGLGSGSSPVTRGVPLSLGNGLYITFATTGNIDASTRWTLDVPNKTSSTYAANLYAYQSAQIAQPKAVAAAQDTVATAKNNLTKAQADLDTKTAPPETADVAAAKVAIESAKVSLSNAELAYSNTLVTAPFDGVVASLSARVGDQASSGSALATVITKSQIAEITLNEVDVAKVKLGQKATLTFDAIDGLTITGQVSEVGLVGTATQGVVNYPVKISFDTSDDRVRSGMSVNAAIITDVKQDVLKVPTSAVKTGGQGPYVQTLENNQPVNHIVQTGLSSDTETEVSGDIHEADLVITQTITQTKTTASTQTNRQQTGLGALGGNATFRTVGGGGFGK